MSQYQANIDLSTLNGTDGFVMHGALQNAIGASGTFVDVNGDGIKDLVVGAVGLGGGLVLFGGANGVAAPGGTFDFTTLDGTNGFAFTGGAYGGVDVDGGDINGDGIADLVVGASSDTGSTGAAYIVFGHTGNFAASLDLSTLDGNNGFKLLGAQSASNAGYSLSSADINGDGFADIVVGARLFDQGANTDAGKVYVLFGKQSGFTATVDLATAPLDGTDGFVVNGEPVTNGDFGRTVSAGDINGDGIGDVIVGAPGINNYQGATYVVFGHTGAFSASIDAGTLDGTNGFKLTDASHTSVWGSWSVTAAGDLNGDGIGDLGVTIRDGQSNGHNTGIVYVVFGKSSGQPAAFDLSTVNGTTGFKIDGGNDFAYDGFSISAAGDVNGDGFGDILLGASAQGGAYVGGGYVVFGKIGGFSAELDVTTLDGTNGFKLTAPAGQNESIGTATAAGDLNNDGLGDLMLGSIGAPGGNRTGTVYVVYGKLPDAPVTRIGTNAGQTLVGGDFNDVLDGKGGNDTLWGHGGNDLMIAGTGIDTLYGGDGDDGFAFGADYTVADKVDGGNGTNDQVALTGSYSLTLSAASITNVEVFALFGTFTYGLITADDLVGAGQTMTFWSVSMPTGGHVNIDAHAETDGNFRFFLGQDSDSIIGGTGNDLFYGEGGQDILRGGGGINTFAYLGVSDSTGTAYDFVDFVAGTDKFDLPTGTTVTGIDAKVIGPTLTTAAFNSDMQAAIGAAQLAAGHAVLFQPGGTDYAGHHFMIVDANGTAGYQAGADYLFDVTDAATAALSTSDFI